MKKESNVKVVKRGDKDVKKKIKENFGGAKSDQKNLEANQLRSRKNIKRGPEKIFKETKLINGGKFQIIKCAEFGIERSTKKFGIFGKSLGVGKDTTNLNLGRPTNEITTSTKVEMAGKPSNEKPERMHQSTKSDSLDDYSTKPFRNTVENIVELENVDFVLTDNSNLSWKRLEVLKNDPEKIGSHQKHKKEGQSSGKSKRKRKSLEASPQSPKKFRKGVTICALKT